MEYQIALWANDIYLSLANLAMVYYNLFLIVLILALVVTGITPVSPQKDHTDLQALLVYVRKALLYALMLMGFWALLMLGLFQLTNIENSHHNLRRFGDWLLSLVNPGQLIFIITVAYILKIMHWRYTRPALSSLMRRWRNPRTKEHPSDIRNSSIFLKNVPSHPKDTTKKTPCLLP